MPTVSAHAPTVLDAPEAACHEPSSDSNEVALNAQEAWPFRAGRSSSDTPLLIAGGSARSGRGLEDSNDRRWMEVNGQSAGMRAPHSLFLASRSSRSVPRGNGRLLQLVSPFSRLAHYGSFAPGARDKTAVETDSVTHSDCRRTLSLRKNSTPAVDATERRCGKWQAKATVGAILVAICFGSLVGFPWMRIMKDWHNYVNGRTS